MTLARNPHGVVAEIGWPMSAGSTAHRSETPPEATDARDVTAPLPADSRSTAEVLKELRRAFPDKPLAERVAALTALSRS
jgi:hypothetical protein